MTQRKDKTRYSVIGAMAGSSMDGLDLAYTQFEINNGVWTYSLNECVTVPYEPDLHDQLQNAPGFTSEQQERLDHSFGQWIGEKISAFKKELPAIDLLGVHGHTVIHQPKQGISWQLGNGKEIASSCKIMTVTDFRSLDIAHGGEGAPLVPFGDFTLFADYDACLNLGGIANISLKSQQVAWDICPCNQVLDFFAKKLGKQFDEGGKLASQGSLDQSFYEQLSQLTFFAKKPPKSLPNKFIDEKILESISPLDGLHTYCQLIAQLICDSLPSASKPMKLLITGGGAFHTFLVRLIQEKLNGWEVEIPDKKLVNFKEALVFAFLALKKIRKEVNVLSSVTGASKDTSSGVIHTL